MTTLAEPTSTDTGGVLSPQYRALTIGMVALITLVAFESLAVATAMPTVAQALDGLRLYALAFGGPLASTLGTWRWQVTYSGDVNNNPATSACGVERFTLANG